MMHKRLLALAAALLTSVSLIAVASAPAHAAGEIKCHMHFNLHGWSIFYKKENGTGVVTCSNGQRMAVDIRVRGGGLTVGKSTVDNGHGSFTGVYDISDVLGGYATGGAHAGAVKSSDAAVLTKGPVSLAISGTGRGWDLGVDAGAFIISRAAGKKQ